MIFNSLVFLVFLPVVLGGYYLLRKKTLQNRFLLVASYVFYGWWDWRFLLLIAFSTVVDYAVAQAIQRRRDAASGEADPERLRPLLWVSLGVNLGVLAFFKYFNFFAGSAEELMLALGMTPDWPTLNVILPVGISFYTFQTLSYTVDVYRGSMRVVDDFFDFALYVSFFPQLVAGPIERAQTLMPQVQSERSWDASRFTDGVWLILLGFVKKVVIADQLAQVANVGFQSDSLGYGWLGSIVYAFAFAFQIYGDFSGYSDIARGIAKLMGFELMINFRRPYLTRNPSEFWRHWHISLSSWLRDYLYIPLGGNRGGEAQTYRNLMITMILGGLWHGAGWGFVLWGLFHGGFLAVHRLWTRRIRPTSTPETERRGLGHVLVVAAFFTVFVTHWMLFRASSLPEGESQLAYAANWFVQFTRWGGSADVVQYLPALVAFGLLALLPQWKDEAMERFHSWRPSVQGLAVAGALLLIAVFGVFEGTEFIYFQF